MRLPAAAVLALLAAPVAAQVFVVDEANGAGTDYTDLPAAIAAVPDGATLRVRPGSTPPRIVGKGLQIVGEDAASVFLSKTPTVDPGVYQTAAGQTVLLKALTFGDLLPIAPRDFTVRGTRGAVVFDDVHTTLSIPSLHPFLIEDAAQVQFHRCTLGPFLNSSFPAPPVQVVRSSVHFAHAVLTGPSGMIATAPALRLEASRCVAVATVFVGGSGQSGCPFRLCGTAPGSAAVEAVAGSTFLGLGTTCDGGRGADEFVSTQPPAVLCATDGGDGISADASTLRLLGSVENGGAGGAAGSRCAPGNAGLPLRATGGSTVIRDANAVPAVADMTPRSVRGQTVTFGLVARAASPAALLLAYDPTLVPVDPLAPGSLLARAALSIPAVVPAGGSLQLPFTVPLTWPLGETYFGQFVSADPVDGSLWVSNALPWHTNR